MKIIASKRSAQGSGASRRLRRSAKVPGIIYGGTVEPTPIEIDHNPLYHSLRVEAFHSSLLDMELDGKTEQVLLRDVQWHAYKPQVLHIDFQRVEATTKLQMKVPLHFSGEENSPAVKLDACLINHIVNELEITCLPADLPEFIAVDLSNLKKGTSLHVNDMSLPQGVTAVTRGKENPVIVSVVTPVAEVVEAPAAAAPAKGKAAAKPKK
jgi:large subunit ribosomal protein L25